MAGEMETGASIAAKTINAHNEARRFVIDSPEHGLVMLLTDLIEWADGHGVDFMVAVEEARDTFDDCQR